MAYSESLAARLRAALRGERGLTEKKMFGGLAFFVRGNLVVCAWKHALIARLGPEAADRALTLPHVGPFDVTGRAMRGWVLVEPEGLESDSQLAAWVEQALEYVRTLPSK